MNFAALEESLIERGWAVIDLPEPTPVLKARERLLSWLRDNGLPALAGLDAYHSLVRNEELHVQLLHGLSRFYWDAELGQSILRANVDLLRRLIGPDLHIQRFPYLRAVRPVNDTDAAPLHRDTYYGASPYEISFVIPFTEMQSQAAVRVISGSHVAPDSDYPYVQKVSAEVLLGSPRHQLGFPYAPRVLAAGLERRAQAVPLEVGQALVFGLSLVHGGGINRGSGTRFSTDIRVANSLAPVRFSRGVRADYFTPFSRSALSLSAQRYLAACQEPPNAAAQKEEEI